MKYQPFAGQMDALLGKEVPFGDVSEMINSSEVEWFAGEVKRLPNAQVLHVYNSLQAALLHKNAGNLDRQKCCQFMTALVKLKFDYLQNVPNLKQELATMQTLIEQRSRIVKDSHRILGRLQLILNKNSSPSGSSSNDLDSSYSTSSDDSEKEDEIEDIDFDDDDDDEDDDDDDEDSSFEEGGVRFQAGNDDDDDDEMEVDADLQNGHLSDDSGDDNDDDDEEEEDSDSG